VRTGGREISQASLARKEFEKDWGLIMLPMLSFWEG